MKEKTSTKAQILAVAGEYFSQYGYEGTGMDAIASDCGITKPAIYYHFKDKAALYEAVLISHLSTLAQEIESNILGNDPKEDLEAYIRIFGTYLITVPTFAAIFSRVIANDAKQLSGRCIEALAKIFNQLLLILRRGGKEEVFACENPFMIQMMIVTTLSAYNTTKTLRRKVSQKVQPDYLAIDPDIENIIDNLSKKIIKALSC